jgi:hypothetical protein
MVMWVARSAVLAVVATLGSTMACAEPRAVVELFTSQGCSSCPPADQLLGKLAEDSTVIALSLPIDYWDYLGWKDTLARPRHTARQRGYAHKRGDREVYTPQVVVNGAVHVLGSDQSAIERAISTTRKQTGVLSLPVKLSHIADKLTVDVPAVSTAGPAEVWVCAVTKAVPVTIAKGENHGKTITYHNVVRRWIKLGDWSGAAKTFSIPIAELKAEGADAAAIMIQGGTAETPGTLLGAAYAAVN